MTSYSFRFRYPRSYDYEAHLHLCFLFLLLYSDYQEPFRSRLVEVNYSHPTDDGVRPLQLTNITFTWPSEKLLKFPIWKTSDGRSFALKYFELCIYASEPLVLEKLPCRWSVPWIKLHYS